MLINLSTMTRVKASAAHRAKAISQLPQVRANDLADLRTKALAAGFRDAGGGEFTHPDGSWVTIVNGKIERGVNQELITDKGWLRESQRVKVTLAKAAALPTTAAAFGQRTYLQFGHEFAAVAKVPQIVSNDLNELRATALAHGFVETRANFYQHKDGSWVGLLDGPQIEKGYRGSIFWSHVSVPYTAEPAGPGTVVPTLALGQVAHAVAKSGVANNLDLLTSKGFVKVTDGYYQAPDKTWVLDTGKRPLMGQAHQRLTPKSFMSQKVYDTLPKVATTTSKPVQPFEGTLAIARAPKNLTASTLHLHKSQLLADGFVEASPLNFTHSDGSWFRVFDDGFLYAGHGQTRLNYRPNDLSTATLNLKYSTPRRGALSQIVEQVESNGFAASIPLLESNGFVRMSANFYQHPDDSWVGLIDGKLAMGTDIYSRVTASSYVPAPTLLAPGPNGFAAPPNNPTDVKWVWYQENTALGRTPMIQNDAQSRQHLQNIGYQQGLDSQGQEHWLHGDGSFVTFRKPDGYGQVKVDLGYKNWKLWELPYNDRTSTPQP